MRTLSRNLAKSLKIPEEVTLLNLFQSWSASVGVAIVFIIHTTLKQY